MFVKINKNYLLVIFFLTLYLSNHRLSSVDSFHQFIRHQYFHLREAKPLLAQVLNGCSYVIVVLECGGNLTIRGHMLDELCELPMSQYDLVRNMSYLVSYMNSIVS